MVVTGRADDPAGTGLRLWEREVKPAIGSGWRQGGQRHYGKGFRADDWSAGVYWDGMGDAAGTWMLEVRQAALDQLAPEARLRLLLLGRPRRLDIALDDGYQRCRPRDLFHGARAARSRSRKDRWRLEMTALGALTTLYVGSRASTRMLRVYDKPPMGVRHELELKGDAADEAGSWLALGWPVDRVYWQEYDRVAQWPDLPGWVALRGS